MGKELHALLSYNSTFSYISQRNNLASGKLNKITYMPYTLIYNIYPSIPGLMISNSSMDGSQHMQSLLDRVGQHLQYAHDAKNSPRRHRM